MGTSKNLIFSANTLAVADASAHKWVECSFVALAEKRFRGALIFLIWYYNKKSIGYCV